MDLSSKQSDHHQVSETEDMSSQTTPTPERISSSDGTYLKTCADCGTTKTPLWRSGPAGPKSLCNACGIRSRKKRRALMGPKEEKKIKKPSSSNIIIINKKHNNSHHHHHQSSDASTCSSSSGCGGENNKNNNNNNNNSISKSGEKPLSFKSKLLGFGCNNNITPMQRPRSNITGQRRRKISEVEQAAFVLMALSCGSVYA